jgi:hypothetical protein
MASKQSKAKLQPHGSMHTWRAPKPVAHSSGFVWILPSHMAPPSPHLNTKLIPRKLKPPATDAKDGFALGSYQLG